jgi:hypothetical protein
LLLVVRFFGRPRFLNGGTKHWAEEDGNWLTCVCVISNKGGLSDDIVDLKLGLVPTKRIIW